MKVSVRGHISTSPANAATVPFGSRKIIRRNRMISVSGKTDASRSQRILGLVRV